MSLSSSSCRRACGQFAILEAVGQRILLIGEQEVGIGQWTAERDQVRDLPGHPKPMFLRQQAPLLFPVLANVAGMSLIRHEVASHLLDFGLHGLGRLVVLPVHLLPKVRDDVIRNDAAEAMPDQHDSFVSLHRILVQPAYQVHPCCSDRSADGDVLRGWTEIPRGISNVTDGKALGHARGHIQDGGKQARSTER